MIKLFSLIICLFLILIFHENVSFGVSYGLLLWYQELIPALLPFIMITNALSETHAYEKVSLLFANRFPHIYNTTALILGNLCGYPIGAKILNDFVTAGNISPENANDLIAVSSQASPMFLLGFVYPLLPNNSMPVYIFMLLIYVPTTLLYFLKISKQKTHNSLIKPTPYINDKDLTNTFTSSVRIMVTIGIYVMIFSILLSILTPISDSYLYKCVLSSFEITTGLKLINTLPLSDTHLTCLITSLASFGGLCASFQINSVLTYQNATIKKYLRDKILLSAGIYLITYIYLSIRFSYPL